ncbi:ribokinase [Candidatus Atribacteria bacterium CG2_30_33_13]|uniref:Ribokinase n=1 Tax=Candidatus Infernicultor aquiphilus TaxID=1805029 RepID=A0A1J5G3N6_9BACT|nr:MAG: ribokinase [Candidatus Atribacteria bacterium CG2_30_33_13]
MINLKKSKIVIVGSYNTDLMSKTPWLPKQGETVLGGPFKLGPGGKGSNQAVAASRLGAEVHFIGCVGEDYFGEIARNNFIKEKINIDYLKISRTNHTGMALILVDDKTAENMIVVAPGANMEINILLVENARDIIVSADVVLLQLEISVEIVEYVVKMVYESNKAISILNPAPGKKLERKVWEKVSLITPNRSELELITNRSIVTVEEAEKAAQEVISVGVKNVIVTLGGEGALVVNTDKTTYVPSYQVDIVDTTGAGDAFNGGLAIALSEGKDLVEATKFANAAAALKVTKIGTAPAMPYREEVERFLKDYQK